MPSPIGLDQAINDDHEAVTRKCPCISAVNLSQSAAFFTSAFLLPTRASDASFCFSVWGNSFPARAPGVFAASCNRALTNPPNHREDGERDPQRLEVGHQQEKDGSNSQGQPHAQSGNRTLQTGYLPAHNIIVKFAADRDAGFGRGGVNRVEYGLASRWHPQGCRGTVKGRT